MYWLTKIAQNKLLVGILLSLTLSLVFGSMAFAAVGAECGAGKPACAVSETCVSGKCALVEEDVFGLGEFNEGVGGTLGNQDLRFTVGKIINVALSLLGVVAVVIVLLGGFKWMTAGGNEEKTTEARKLIFAGIIGLAIILSAWAIALFVLKSLATATGSGATGIPTFE